MNGRQLPTADPPGGDFLEKVRCPPEVSDRTVAARW